MDSTGMWILSLLNKHKHKNEQQQATVNKLSTSKRNTSTTSIHFRDQMNLTEFDAPNRRINQ